MKTLLKLAAVTSVTALMLVAVAACGKKDDAKVADKAGEATTTSAAVAAKASCTMVTELGTCNEYKAGTTFTLEKSLCEGFHGKFAHAACSTEGQLGSCVMSDGEVKRYYGAKVAGEHALTADEAKNDCESDAVKGKFARN
ncbi:MAG: hypothetical protein JWO86_8122 [Myxococcaceae bacterium]|jgi:hypothetical protein|nr:hypothetical protein [Myxococcaceae bacterium]MEA2745987.1 hypothetical protein [Myxococcales bacterium]